MHAVIVGNGVAGVSCAFEIRKRNPDWKITLISKETDYFFSRTALMYCYMDRMKPVDLEPYERSVYKKQRIELIRDEVINFNSETKKVELKNSPEMVFDKLVLALGAAPRNIPWQGSQSVKEGIVNFVSMQDLEECERLTPTTSQAVVVGGGLIGIELVECLLHHNIQTTFLIREPFFWPVALGEEEAQMVGEHMREHGVDLRFGEQIESIESDSSGRVSSLKTDKNNTLPCQMLGVCVGVSPAIEWLSKVSTPPQLGRGIQVNSYFETSLPDVYACGDCAEIHSDLSKPSDRPLLELIWYSAKRQGELTGVSVSGLKRAYEPPIFYNSSKFFEIEYTTVGVVNQSPKGSKTVTLKLEEEKASVRLIQNERGRLIGFNGLGARFDHTIIEDWIEEQWTVEQCIQNLKSAQFDVEFGRIPFENATVTHDEIR